MNEKEKSFAELLKKRDVNGLREFFKKYSLDANDELMLLKSYDISIIAHYATLFRLREDNLMVILNKETPEYVIENIIKMN